MRAAVIDLGSNSIRLLVADISSKGEVIPVARDLITTRLGRGVNQNNILDEKSISDTVSALVNFRNKAKSLGSESIFAFGTSALREASNSSALLEKAKEIGINVEILSGEREALLSFFGARLGLKTVGVSLVIDIGGNSTEFVLGDDEKIEKAESLPIGAVRWTQKYIKSDPPAFNEIAQARKQIDLMIKDFADYFKKVKESKEVTVVGVGGTLTTLAAVAQELEIYDSNKVHGYVLNKQTIDDIFLKLLFKTSEERLKVKGLMPQRADIITAGVLIAKSIMEDFNISQITVSESDIMEAYLVENLESSTDSSV